MICSVDKHFTYIPDPADSSKTVVHETEILDALGDSVVHH
jgi:hypothetical protein